MVRWFYKLTPYRQRSDITNALFIVVVGSQMYVNKLIDRLSFILYDNHSWYNTLLFLVYCFYEQWSMLEDDKTSRHTQL